MISYTQTARNCKMDKNPQWFWNFYHVRSDKMLTKNFYCVRPDKMLAENFYHVRSDKMLIKNFYCLRSYKGMHVLTTSFRILHDKHS